MRRSELVCSRLGFIAEAFFGLCFGVVHAGFITVGGLGLASGFFEMIGL